MRSYLKNILIVAGGIAFFWLFGLKFLIKLMKGHSAPCPSSISWLVDLPIRKRSMRPVLDRVGIKPGETILEVGPGPGAFSIDAARRLGNEGKLIAVDIQPEMIRKLEARIRQANLTNIETHVANAYELPVADESVDRAFFVTVLPEIPDPVRALKEVHRVLRAGGLLSITEEFLDPDYPLRQTTIAWANAAGFKLSECFGNFWLYTLNFHKA